MAIHTSTPSSLTTMDSAYWAILTLEETEALFASNYPCQPGYRPPAGWMLSAGGVPAPPVPQGSVRQAAITNHFYHELTPEQRMDPQWDPDNYDTPGMPSLLTYGKGSSPGTRVMAHPR